MAKPLVTPGQGTFVFGIDPTNRIMVDATKPITVTSEAVGGYPAALINATGATNSNASAANDLFYGASASDINQFSGRTTLGEFEAKKGLNELIGRYTIRRSVFLDSNGDEVTAVPFSDGSGGASFPATTDVGKAIHALRVTVSDALDAFNGTEMLKWVVATGSAAKTGGSAKGFFAVGQIVAVSDDATEVEIMLTGKTEDYVETIIV